MESPNLIPRKTVLESIKEDFVFTSLDNKYGPRVRSGERLIEREYKRYNKILHPLIA
jgi:hypothetical protein